MNDLTPEVKIIALNLMEGLSCPRSVTVAILIRYGEWVQLAKLTADPYHYADAQSYLDAASASDFLRKYPGLPTEIDTEAAAIEKWWEAEHQCKRTNVFFDSYLDPLWGENDERILRFLSDVRKEVVTLIGACPPTHLNVCFGPGATMSDNSRATTVADKMSSVPTLTPKAWIHLSDWMSTKWGQAQAALGHEAIEVQGNKYFTVKKDATTDRSCGKEPSICAAYQLAVGQAMRRRLLRSGIDLKDGQGIHRARARAASLSGEDATIDLTSASDMVAYNVVKLLVPPAWFSLLDSLRSPCTHMPNGKWVRLEKFSSMGNGYTFELETVIFCAIARAVCKDDSYAWSRILVYGDDIIAPTTHCELIVSALKFCGFVPNKKKTHTKGAFRESCGGDFFNGEAVRPYFLKEIPYGPEDYICIANGVRRLAYQGHFDANRWNRVKRAWFCCLDNIPSRIRACRGPSDLGDTVIHDDERYWSTKTSLSIRYVKCYTPVAGREVRWEGFAYDVQFAVALYLAGKGRERRTRLPNGNLTPRDPVTGYKVSWTAFS